MSIITKEENVLDMEKAEQFAGQFILDLSASYSGVMVIIGQELGLYKAMQGHGPITPVQLAEKTNTLPGMFRSG